MNELLQGITQYMLFFGLSGVVEGNRVYSIEENEQKAPYFELWIQDGEYITYTINLSKNKVYSSNIPILSNDYTLLFILLKIDFEGVQKIMNELKNNINNNQEVL